MPRGELLGDLIWVAGGLAIVGLSILGYHGIERLVDWVIGLAQSV